MKLSIKNNLILDKMAKNLYPTDAPAPQCVPAKVNSDGDCLAWCASILAYGYDLHPFEIRVRIIQELVVNEDYYLQEENLRQGLPDEK